ncbi:MAG: hypothetical protein R3A48_12900 [Polyangiales bacterium]
MASKSDDEELRAYLIAIAKALGNSSVVWDLDVSDNNRTLAAYALGLTHGRAGIVPVSRGDLKAAVDGIVSGDVTPSEYVPPPPPEPSPRSGF